MPHNLMTVNNSVIIVTFLTTYVKFYVASSGTQDFVDRGKCVKSSFAVKLLAGINISVVSAKIIFVISRKKMAIVMFAETFTNRHSFLPSKPENRFKGFFMLFISPLHINMKEPQCVAR